MTKWWTQFEKEEVGLAFPSEWRSAAYRMSGADYIFSDPAVADVDGVRCFRGETDFAGNTAAIWDGTYSPPATADDLEIFARLRFDNEFQSLMLGRVNEHELDASSRGLHTLMDFRVEDPPDPFGRLVGHARRWTGTSFSHGAFGLTGDDTTYISVPQPGWYRLRVQFEADTMRARWWADADPEPETWARTLTGIEAILSGDQASPVPSFVGIATEYVQNYASRDPVSPGAPAVSFFSAATLSDSDFAPTPEQAAELHHPSDPVPPTPPHVALYADAATGEVPLGSGRLYVGDDGGLRFRGRDGTETILGPA